jgi:hypothetical protein
MGVNRRDIDFDKASLCDASNFFFDPVRGTDLMEQFVLTGVPCDELLEMVQKLYVKLTRHPDYKGYTDEIKEDMISTAYYEFLKYGHNFKANKARNGAYTFLQWNARNSFNRELKKHYRNRNLKEALAEPEVIEEWHRLYADNLLADRDEVLSDS